MDNPGQLTRKYLWRRNCCSIINKMKRNYKIPKMLRKIYIVRDKQNPLEKIFKKNKIT